MNEPKFPQGEWRYSGQNGIPGHCMVAQIWGPLGRSLAEIEPTDDPDVATDTARLMAAAPKLLKACQAMFALLDAEYGDGIKNGYWPTVAPILKQAQDAIKGATVDS